jgi:predicted AAA+ superfamily ATPase
MQSFKKLLVYGWIRKKRLRDKDMTVAVTGPRQSGKTTFAQALCPDYKYVNLELPDERQFALIIVF